MLDKEEGEYPTGSCDVRTWGATVTLNTPNASLRTAVAGCLPARPPRPSLVAAGSEIPSPPFLPCRRNPRRVRSPQREVGVRQLKRLGAAEFGGCGSDVSAAAALCWDADFEESPRTVRCTRVAVRLFFFVFAPAKLARQPLTSPRDGR